MLAWAMRWFGLRSIRGSSSCNGKQGLCGIVEQLEKGFDVAFAVDGPRGPMGIPHPGALAAAARTGAWVVPYAVACSRVTTLRSWDRFQIPWPFCRVVVVLGEPIVEAGDRSVGCLARRIEQATETARDVLGRMDALKEL
jgi:lysophospholipid acyltransferase (LPLAT)-like uncharacterized protein